MTTSFFILLSIPAVCFVILVLCSPRGYQDEKGFHYGTFPAPQKSSKRVDDDADEPARGRESFCAMSDPRNIHAHARNMLIERIMALIGRASAEPLRFRRRLEALDDYELRKFYQTLEDGLE